VQIEPIKPTLKASDTKRLKLKYYTLLSSCALNFNLRRYTMPTQLPPSPHDVVTALATRYPRGRRKFRVALARSALHAAETAAVAAGGGLPLTAAAASAVAAALRLFIAAVAPDVAASRGGSGGGGGGGGGGDGGRGGGGGGGGKRSRASSTAPLGADMMRCAKLFTSASSDERGAPAATAAADACAALAAWFLASPGGGGGGGGGSGGRGRIADGGVVTQVAVAVSLAAMSLPSPACVAAGLRLAAGMSDYCLPLMNWLPSILTQVSHVVSLCQPHLPECICLVP
jgi:hypothetical protein